MHRSLTFHSAQAIQTILLLFLILCLCPPTTLAQYPAAKRNADVRSEIEKDNADSSEAGHQRLIPVSRYFAFAGDADVYERALGGDDFYHGIGYWLQFRSEADPISWLRLNLRSIFYAGSASGGYAEPGGSYHLFAMTVFAPKPIFGGELKLRAADLDRQDFGEGLLIQDKEMNGFLLSWQHPIFTLTLRVDGTGLFRQPDDTYNLELGLSNRLLRGGAVVWPQGMNEDQLDHNRASYLYVFSGHRIEILGPGFAYGAEAGERGGAWAGMIALKDRRDLGSVGVDAKIEARRYGPAFANDFAGQIQQQYISYDQYDKDFTNAANIFVIGDDVYVGALHLNAHWKVNHDWRLHSLNEIGRLDYRGSSAQTQNYYYFRQGAEFCPFPAREDCLNLFVSNKVLSDSFSRPPHEVSTVNATLFKTLPFFGAEGRVRF